MLKHKFFSPLLCPSRGWNHTPNDFWSGTLECFIEAKLFAHFALDISYWKTQYSFFLFASTTFKPLNSKVGWPNKCVRQGATWCLELPTAHQTYMCDDEFLFFSVIRPWFLSSTSGCDFLLLVYGFDIVGCWVGWLPMLISIYDFLLLVSFLGWDQLLSINGWGRWGFTVVDNGFWSYMSIEWDGCSWS